MGNAKKPASHVRLIPGLQRLRPIRPLVGKLRDPRMFVGIFWCESRRFGFRLSHRLHAPSGEPRRIEGHGHPGEWTAYCDAIYTLVLELRASVRASGLSASPEWFVPDPQFLDW